MWPALPRGQCSGNCGDPVAPVELSCMTVTAVDCCRLPEKKREGGTKSQDRAGGDCGVKQDL